MLKVSFFRGQDERFKKKRSKTVSNVVKGQTLKKRITWDLSRI